MSFFKGPSQREVAAHPLPDASVRSNEAHVVETTPDFNAVLGELRRSFLDQPVDPTTLNATVGAPIQFVRICRVPRRTDEGGRVVPAGADREGHLLTSLHGLGHPIAFRVENRSS